MEDALDGFSTQRTCHEKQVSVRSNSPVSHGQLGKMGLAQNSLPDVTNPEDEIDSPGCVNRCERTKAGLKKKKSKGKKVTLMP